MSVNLFCVFQSLLGSKNLQIGIVKFKIRRIFRQDGEDEQDKYNRIGVVLLTSLRNS